MSDENLEVEEIELTEEEKLKLAEEERLRLEEEEKLRLEKEKEDKIQELIDSVDFEELETYTRGNRELEEEEEYQDKLVHRFFHWKQFPFCDCIEIKEELVVDGEVQLDKEGKPIEGEFIQYKEAEVTDKQIGVDKTVGKRGKDVPGCKIRKHESKEDEDEENDKRNKQKARGRM